MLFVKTDELKSGMRIAKPIYNRMGVMLYERDTKLTPQGINSIQNFGLIGIYILEAAEPVPPISKEEAEFEQFQTIAVFQIRDDMVMLKNNKAPSNLSNLVQEIIRRYGALDHKLPFTQNLRSSTDFVYKHAISVAILAALITHEMQMDSAAQSALVYAALLYDLGMQFVPSNLFEKGNDLSEEEQKQIHTARETGLGYLDPVANSYNLPTDALSIISQMIHNEFSPDTPAPKGVVWLAGTRILHVIDKFDNLTAMSLSKEPISEIMAMRYLMEYPNIYNPAVVTALGRCIHILPIGSSVDLSNGDRGLVVVENPLHFLAPVILNFRTNALYDLSKPEIAKEVQIEDIMKTMDNRIAIDSDALEHFSADSRILDITEKFRKKKIELERRAKIREAKKKEEAAAKVAAAKTPTPKPEDSSDILERWTNTSSEAKPMTNVIKKSADDTTEPTKPKKFKLI